MNIFVTGKCWSLAACLAVLAAGNFIVAINIHILSGLLNEVAASLGISIMRAGMLIAAASALTCLAAPLCATWGSTLDRRYLLGGALMICAVASVLGALSQTYGQLLSTRLLGAMTSAIFLPQAAATVVLMVEEERRPQALSMVLLGVGGGLVLGVPAGVMIGSAYGWRTAMACLGVAAFMLSMMAFRVLPPRLKVAPLNLASWRKVLASPALLLMLGATAMLSAGNACVSYVAPMTAALPHADDHTLSAICLAFVVAWVAGTAASGLLVRRVGARALACGAGLLVIVSFALRPLAVDWLAAAFVVHIAWGLGASCFFTVQQTRVVNLAPAMSSASIALSSSLNYLGFAVGAVYGGFAWEWVGPRYLTLTMVWWVVCAVAFTLLADRAARREGTKASEPADQALEQKATLQSS